MSKSGRKLAARSITPAYLLAQEHILVEQLRTTANTPHEDKARFAQEMEALTTERSR